MDQFKKYYAQALRFLARRSRSEKEIRDNLLKKKADPSIIEMVVAKLKEQKFLNDEEFTKWWIEQRSEFSQKSKRVIKIELIKKGIDKETIESLLNNQVSKVDELQLAKKVIEKKLPRLQKLSNIEIRQKLQQLLLRRGFDFDTISQVVDEVLHKGV